MARLLVSVALLLFAACGDDGDDDDNDKPLDDPRWNTFVAAREGHLRALAAPIVACVGRQDTAEPAFHGCYDWHSAVHGTFSLLAISRLIDDPQYAAAAEAVLEPSAVAAELERLRSTGISYEIPYGYAWFLTLARERSRGGNDDLMPLAAEVVADLETYVFSLDATSIHETALAPDYENLSWVVENLHAHAVFTGDAARAAAITAFARDKLLPLDGVCPLGRDAMTTNQFFPPCLHRVLALAHVLPAEEVAAWIAAFAPGQVSLAPLTTATTPHSAGVDFSRAWGLYALWRATANLDHLHLYLDHVETWMALPQFWAMDYDNYSHWVAQFGVYAIASSFDEDGERL